MINYEVEFTLLLDIQLNRELYKKLHIVNYHGNLVVADIKQNIRYSKPYAIITLTNKDVIDKKYPKNVHEVCLNCGSQFITEEYEYIVKPKLISRCVNCLI